MSIIKFQNVYKSIGKREIIRNVSMEINKGQVYGLLGPNGAGKTTIIRLMINLLKPTTGNIYWYNSENSKSFKEKLGIILHDDGLYLSLSGFDNLKIFSLLQGEYDEDALVKILEEVGLSNVCKEPVSTYSQGMKKRLCLARCILRNADVIIMDEPTAGLDIDGKHWFVDKIRELQNMGKTIVISSHDLMEIEAVCTHIAIVRKGEIVFDGVLDNMKRIQGTSLEELYLRTGDAYVLD